MVNESFRKETYSFEEFNFSVQTINPSQKIKDKCSWACHDSTKYCEEHHIIYKSIKRVDFLYDRIIGFLRSGISTVEGFNYGMNNIIFLVTLWPLWMIYLFVQVIFNNKNK